MRVKAHPHKPMVDNGSPACISVTPMKRHGRAYYMGTVYLSEVGFTVHPSGHERYLEEDVRNVHAWVTGELLSESIERFSPDHRILDNFVKVKYDLASGRFLAGGKDVTDVRRNAAVLVGPKVYISKF